MSRRTRVGAAAGGAIVLALVAFVALPMVWRHQAGRVDLAPATPMRTSGSFTDSNERRQLDEILRLQSGLVDQQVKAQQQGLTTR